MGVRNSSERIRRRMLSASVRTTNWVRASLARSSFPSPRYLLIMALPPVPSMVAMAMATLMTGYTIFSEDRALLPRKRETKMPSTMV